MILHDSNDTYTNTYRFNIDFNRIEFWSYLNEIWMRSILNEMPVDRKVVSYKDTWCEPYEGMEEYMGDGGD